MTITKRQKIYATNSVTKLSNEYKQVYNKLLLLSDRFRDFARLAPADLVISDSPIVDLLREAGDSASVAAHRSLEVHVWLNKVVDEIKKIPTRSST